MLFLVNQLFYSLYLSRKYKSSFDCTDMKKTLLCLLALIGFSVGAVMAQTTCFSAWQYLAPVQVNNTNLQLTDFQVSITVDTQTPIGSGKMNSDGSDIRFAGPDCCTELPYWIQSGLNTTNTQIWVRIPSLTAGSVTSLMMYYGNNTATTQVSSLDSTMFTIGNDDTGSDPGEVDQSIGTKNYLFPMDVRTVRFRIYSGDSTRIRFKTVDSTDNIKGVSPFFNTGAAAGFYSFDWEGGATVDGYPGWYSDSVVNFMNNCAPVTPCPGSCGDMIYANGDAGVTSFLTTDSCGAYPSMRVWYRNFTGAFFDPITSIGSEFDRNMMVTTSATLDTVCPGDTTVISTPNNGALSYSWFRNNVFVGNGTSITSTQAGDYHVVADFGTCRELTSPIRTILRSNGAVDLGADRTVCTDGSYTIDAGTGYTSYFWSNGSTNQTLEVFTDGLYWIETSDSLGCIFRDTVFINLQALPNPVIVPGDTNDICGGDSLSLDAYDPSFYVYNWSRANETSADILVTTSGSYYVVVTDSFGCTDTSETVVVNFYPQPMVSLPADTVLCDGDTTTLTVTSQWANILWADSMSNGTSFDVFNPGVYWVEVTDTNGCVDRDSIVISVNTSPTVTFPVYPNFICPNSTVNIDPGAGFSAYMWSDGATSQTNDVGVGNHFVVVTDSNGCSGMSPLLSFSAYPSTIAPVIDYDASATLLTSDVQPNYDWLVDGNPIPGANSQTYTPTASGTYSVSTVDTNGCGVFTSNEILVVLEVTQEDIPEGFSPNGDDINDRFEIEYIGLFPQSSLKVLNRWGKEVFSEEDGYSNSFNGQWNGSDLPDGTYFYILDLGDGSEPFSGYLIINR